MAFRNKPLKGSGWGGARVGSGPRPRAKASSGSSGLVAFPGGREADRALAEPPETMPEAQKALWRAWAPLALTERTLTVEKAPSFALLCELEVRRRALGAILDQPGAQPEPAGLRIFAQYAKQVENLMGRFCLAPFGKPVVAEKPKSAANPFAALLAK